MKRGSLHPPHPWIRKWEDVEAAKEKAEQEAVAKQTASVCAGPYEAVQAAANLVRDPSLRECSGVSAVCVDAAEAHRCGEFLLEHWVPFGSLTLPGRKPIRGYATYSQTHAPHDPKLQQEHTLLLTGALLVHALKSVPGLASMADFLVAHLERTLGGRFLFVYAHALRQGPLTQMSTGFKSHQDIETDDLIDRSVV